MNSVAILAQTAPPPHRWPPVGFMAFAVFYMVFGVAGWIAVSRARTVERKRQMHRGLSVAMSVLLLLFIRREREAYLN